MKKKHLLPLLAVACSLATVFAKADTGRENTPLPYPNSIAIDSDLDGLTDEGEKKLFGTDPMSIDTDRDAWYDGTEILAHTDPLDGTAPSATTTVTSHIESAQTPWVWYITRASGLVAFAFAWVVIFLGIAVRLPGLKSILKPVFSLSAHHSLAFQTLFFSLLHGLSFLFDPFIKPSLADIAIPFWTDKIDPLPLALGILALYGFCILVLTSWLKPLIPHRIWRITHFLNIFVYVAVIFHALLLGTDIANPLFRNIFIGANIFLVGLLLLNFALKLVSALRSHKMPAAPTEPAS